MKGNNPKKMLFDNAKFLTEASRYFGQDLDRPNPNQNVYSDYAARYWKLNFGKKFLLPGDNLTRENKALAKFFLVNDEMRILNQRLPHLLQDRADLTSRYPLTGTSIYKIVFMARELIARVLGDEIEFAEITDLARMSSGASVGVSYKDTSLERKWEFPLSYTGEARSYLTCALERDTSLCHAIMTLNSKLDPSELFTLDERGNQETLDSLKYVKGSKGTTVPKTNNIDRFICVEPTINIYMQQGLAEAMWRRMSRWGLSLERDQEKHRRLAFFGSISNRIVTIDFESMSDRVSLAVTKALFPAQWFAAFMDLRSPSCLIRGDWVRNEMISSMGNATTFPIETLILWALSWSSFYHSSVSEEGDGWIDILSQSYMSSWGARHTVGTFGDDVIMPQDGVEYFLDVCNFLGFVPNTEKSFYKEEYFRESCGGDYYHGRDVRPLFLKAFPSPYSKVRCEAHLYTMINRVLKKYFSYFGPVAYVYERQLLAYLFRCLNSVTDEVKFVPEYFPEDSGICAMHDAWRILTCYRIQPSRVGVDKHGSLQFRYLSWESSSRERHDDLRYAVSLLKSELQTAYGSPSSGIFLSADRRDGNELCHLMPFRRVRTDATTREFGKYVVRVAGKKLVPRSWGSRVFNQLAKRLALVTPEKV